MDKEVEMVEVLSPEDWIQRLNHPSDQTPIVDMEPVDSTKATDEI